MSKRHATRRPPSPATMPTPPPARHTPIASGIRRRSLAILGAAACTLPLSLARDLWSNLIFSAPTGRLEHALWTSFNLVIGTVAIEAVCAAIMTLEQRANTRPTRDWTMELIRFGAGAMGLGAFMILLVMVFATSWNPGGEVLDATGRAVTVGSLLGLSITAIWGIRLLCLAWPNTRTKGRVLALVTAIVLAPVLPLFW